MQDIIRGIKKVLDSSKSTGKPTGTTTSAAPGVESLMKRGNLFLEDAEWVQAKEYFDKVLDIDPEYAPAYIGLLCAELRIRTEEDLLEHNKPFDGLPNYKKAIRFASVAYKSRLIGYDEEIKRRLQITSITLNIILYAKKYERLVSRKNYSSTEYEFQALADEFKKMGNYKDTAELANECDAKCIELREKRLERERIAEQQRLEREQREKKERLERKLREEEERLEREKREKKERLERKLREIEEEDKRKRIRLIKNCISYSFLLLTILFASLLGFSRENSYSEAIIIILLFICIPFLILYYTHQYMAREYLYYVIHGVTLLFPIICVFASISSLHNAKSSIEFLSLSMVALCQAGIIISIYLKDRNQ